MIECLRFNPVEVKNTLLGYASIKVTKWGLIVDNVSLHSKNGHYWSSLPARSYEKDGERKWSPYLRMENVEHQKELMKQITDAIVSKMKEQDDPYDKGIMPPDFGCGLFF
jgi:hypothetical protein